MSSLVYVGSTDGMERGIVERESRLPFRALPAAAIRGRGPLAVARNSLTLAAGVVAALGLLGELRPAAILGTGGYVCVPLFLAARARGVPTMIYLPDVVPGLAVRFLARIATKVACSVEDSWEYLRLGRSPETNRKSPIVNHKLLVTGYPVRDQLFGQDRQACRAAFGLSDQLPVLLVYGGSRGARNINRAIEALLPDLLARAQIIHVCGREGDETWLRAAAGRLGPELRERYKLYPYLASRRQGDEETRGQGDTETVYGRTSEAVFRAPALPVSPSMVRAFGAADLAVCRSGASTLAELPAAGLPAVLVPFVGVHQDENADYLVRHGAAVKVADAAMLGTGRPQDGPLFKQVLRLLDDTHERQRMAERCRGLARPHAARHLAEALLSLATRSGG